MENLDRAVAVAFAGMLGYIFYLSWQRFDARAPWLRFAWVSNVVLVLLLIVLSAFNVAIPAWGKYAALALVLGAVVLSRLRTEPRPPEPEAFTQARIGAQMTLSSLQGKNRGEQRD